VITFFRETALNLSSMTEVESLSNLGGFGESTPQASTPFPLLARGQRWEPNLESQIARRGEAWQCSSDFAAW